MKLNLFKKRSLLFLSLGSALLLGGLTPHSAHAAGFGSLAKCEAALQDKYPLTTEALAQATAHSLQIHPTKTQWTPELVEATVRNFLYTIDPGKSLLLKADAAALERPSPETLAQALQTMRGDSPQPILALQEARAKARAALTDSYDFLMKTPDLHDRVMEIVRKPGELPTKEESDFPASVEERHQLFMNSLARVVRDHDKFGISEEDAYITHLRRLVRSFAELDEFLSDDAEPSLILKAFMTNLDAHSGYDTPLEIKQHDEMMKPNYAGMGVSIAEVGKGYAVKGVSPGSGAAEAGLKEGDIITNIDGHPMENIAHEDTVKYTRGEVDSTMRVSVLRGNETLEFTVVRHALTAPAGVKPQVIETKIGPVGVVRLGAFYQGATKDVVNAVVEMTKKTSIQGLVLDLRGNPGGLVPEAVGILNVMIPKGPLVFFSDRTHPSMHSAEPQFPKFNGPVIVLVDEMSASASELVSSTLKDYGRALIVGASRTLGKGSGQAVLPLPNEKGALRLTVGLYYPPSGKTPQLTGVTPDIILADVDPKSFMLETNHKNPIDPRDVTIPPIQFPDLSLPKEFVALLAKQSAERRAADPAWAKVEGSDDLPRPYVKDEGNDLVLKEAGHIFEDWNGIAQEIRRQQELQQQQKQGYYYGRVR